MLKIKKVIDLSQPLYHNCPGWPGLKLTEVKYEAIYPENGYNAERLEFNVHTGTHIDVPFHVSPYGKTVDDVPLENFQGRAVLIDFAKRGIEDCTELNADDFIPYQSRINAGDIVIYNTGWAEKRGMNLDWYNNWSFLSKEAAQWLADKKVKGIGTDSMSVGGFAPGKAVPPHEVLLGSEICIFEELNLQNDILNYETFYFCAFPLKLVGFSGSPVRAVALIPED